MNTKMMKTKVCVIIFMLAFLVAGSQKSAKAQDAYIGEIRMFAGNFAPVNWMLCNGQTLLIAEYTPLYAVIGASFGGDGHTTFNLPDLRGRVPVGFGTGPGLTTRYLGEKSGTETVTLTHSNMPSHSHAASGTVKAATITPPDFANEIDPLGNNFGVPATGTNIYVGNPANVSMASDNVDVTVNPAGSNAPVQNMQPCLGINFIICVDGLFPPRN